MPDIHELIDFTVATYIVYQDKVLLRYHDKYDFWGVPSGHIELAEEPNEAAVREAWEESGLKVTLHNPNPHEDIDNNGFKALISPSYLNMHPIKGVHQHVEFVYFATSESNEVNPQEESDRSDQYVWATLEKLNEMDLKKDVRFYATDALKQLGKS